MEFIDLTSASEDERFQVKGILSNVSRNLEFTCGSKVINKQTKSVTKERSEQNGNQVDSSKNNSKQLNYQSSTASHPTNSSPDQSIVNSSMSSNSSNNSSKMNGFHYNYYNNPHNNLDNDGHNSNSNHQFNHPNHYSNNHYHNHPNVQNSRMQPQPVIPYSTHFIPHNGTLPPDHPTAQYHKMPYYTTPHQFTPNTSSKPFYPTNPATGQHFTPNTVLTSIPSIVTSANGVMVTSNQLHPQTDILSPQQPTDLNTSNGPQQRTNALNDVHSSPYHQVTYNPANGLPSNHHSFMHHPASYIPNAHFAQPNVPMYFVPLTSLPMTQFYPPTHYPPHLATAQPAILTAPPHQPLATPPISPQDQDNDETCSNHNLNCDDNEKNENVSNDVNDNKENISIEEKEIEADEEKNINKEDEDANKDQSTVSNYSFLSPESMEEESDMNNKSDKDELIRDYNEDEVSNDLVDDNVSANDDDEQPHNELFTANELNTTNKDQSDEEEINSNDNVEIIEKDDPVDELNVAQMNLNEVENIIDDKNKTTDQNEKDEKNNVEDSSSENVQTINNGVTAVAIEDKPRSWADLFKSGKMDYNKTTKIIMDDSSNTNNSLFNKTDFEPLGQQIDSIVKLNARNLQQQALKSVPCHEDELFPKLSKKLKDLNLKHSLPLLCPRGFTNSSNWCYINAILQALLYCPPFYNLMREIAETPGIFREKSATPIIDSFAKFFTNFMPNEQLMKRIKTTNFGYDDLPKLEAYEPKCIYACIYNVLGNINNECVKGRQEDAEEFFSAVLNCLHEEMLSLLNYDPKAAQSQQNQTNRQSHTKNSNSSNNSVATNNGSVHSETKIGSTLSSVVSGQHLNEDEKFNTQENAKQAWKAVKNKHKTFTSSNYKNADSQITDIFGGTMLFIRKAGSDVNYSRQPFFTLKLDIQSEKTRTIEDALRNLTISESIHGYLCPKTNKAIEATCQTFLDQLPAILVLHLKLHNDENGQMKKSMKKINFPIDLEMPKECLTQQDRSKYSKTYKLLAVVHHDGKDTAKGHYFTDIYHIGTSLWLRCDDSKIEQISVQQLMHPKDSKIPYLLFYRRCDTLRGSKNQNS